MNPLNDSPTVKPIASSNSSAPNGIAGIFSLVSSTGIDAKTADSPWISDVFDATLASYAGIGSYVFGGRHTVFAVFFVSIFIIGAWRQIKGFRQHGLIRRINKRSPADKDVVGLIDEIDIGKREIGKTAYDRRTAGRTADESSTTSGEESASVRAVRTPTEVLLEGCTASSKRGRYQNPF